MSIEPPIFQEASRCDVCKCSFSAFRRRHHCRCCGRTLCAEHSSNQMALPQFGIHSNVRVCADCFNIGSRVARDGETATPNTVNTITDSISRIDIDTVSESKSEVSPMESHLPGVKDCKCGMPLCICEAPQPQKDTITTQPVTTTSTPSLNSTPKVKNTPPTSKNRGSTSNSKQSNLFNPAQVVNNSMDRSEISYEATGEGLREAIKNGDIAAAKRLLSQGVDANYCDKQGSSLLHLAAVFNQTEIAFALIDHGASVDRKNSQGESPLDCAPATLQYKMKKKLEENMQMDQ